MSAAVGFTAASGITPVFAQETTNAEVIKEDVEAKKTKKEKERETRGFCKECTGKLGCCQGNG